MHRGNGQRHGDEGHGYGGQSPAHVRTQAIAYHAFEEDSGRHAADQATQCPSYDKLPRKHNHTPPGCDKNAKNTIRLYSGYSYPSQKFHFMSCGRETGM